MKIHLFVFLALASSSLVTSAQTISNYEATVTNQLPNYYFTFNNGSLTSSGGGGTNSDVITLASSPASFTQFTSDVYGNDNNSVYFSAVGDALVDSTANSDQVITSGGGGSASTNSTTTGSISFLFKSLDPGALTAQKYILCAGYTTSSHNALSLLFENTNTVNLGGNTNDVELRFGDVTMPLLQASNVVADAWYYFAFTYTEATNGFFFDSTGTNLITIKGKWYLGRAGGTLASGVTTNAIDTVAGQGQLYIGNRSDLGEGFRSPGTGEVDEFATWSRRLSDAEVAAQFAALPQISPPATLAAYQNVIITNQAATYFFPLNGNYVDAVTGLTLHTNTLSSGSYSFAADWFGDPTGSAVFSASAAALTNAANLLSGGGTASAGYTGTGKGSISCLFRTPVNTNQTTYAALYMTPGTTGTSNGFYLRFSTNGVLNLQFGSTTKTILPQTNITGGVWYYFAMNYDETQPNNQVNWWLGQPGMNLTNGTVSAVLGSLAGAGTSFVIGNSTTFGNPFRQSTSSPGYIADFAIWTRILAGTEVTNQFNALVSSSAVTAPVLSITTSGTNVIVSWPSSTDPGYGLQSTPNLASPSWSGAGTPVTIGSQLVVTNAILSTPQFYRLTK